jgi:hypothetical protein
MIHRKDRVACRLAVITLLQDHHEKFSAHLYQLMPVTVASLAEAIATLLLDDLAWGFAEAPDGFQS